MKKIKELLRYMDTNNTHHQQGFLRQAGKNANSMAVLRLNFNNKIGFYTLVACPNKLRTLPAIQIDNPCMKKIIRHFLILLFTVNFYGQDIRKNLERFSCLLNAKTFNLYGNVKSIKEFTCFTDDATLIESKQCKNEKFYYFDSVGRVKAIILSDKDSIAYTYGKNKVEELRYGPKHNYQSIKVLYSLNKLGLITSKTIQNSDGKKFLKNKYDKRNNLIETTEYSNQNKVNHTLKIKYDKFDYPIQLIGIDKKGVISSKFINSYNNKKLIRSLALQSGKQFEYWFTYDDKGNVTKQEMHNSNGQIIETIFKKYDDTENEIQTIITYKNNSGGETTIINEIQYVYDEYKNWTKKIIKSDKSLVVKFRIIRYE